MFRRHERSDAPSRPTFQGQLSLRYAASFLLLLVLLGGITWLNLHHCLVSSLDRNLLVIGHSEADFARHNALQLHAAETGGADEKAAMDLGVMPHHVQLWNADARMLAHNHPHKLPLPLSSPEFQASLQGHSALTHLVYQGQPYRVLYFPLSVGGKPYTLQVATSLASVRRTLWEVMGIYLLSSLAMLALAYGLGWRLARRAVAPLSEITSIAGRISLAELGERVPSTPHTPQEVHELSQMLNQMLDRLENAARALQQFTADAAHELRTPLTILKGEIQVALRKSRPVEEYRDLLESNLEEVNRLIQLAEALLSLSRFERLHSSGQLLQGETDFGRLLAQVAERFAAAADAQGVVLQVETASRPITAAVHPAYIEQVIYNLLDNALQVSPPQSRILLRLPADREQAVFEIWDQGPGIAPEFQARIFERFFQIGASRTGNRQHFGIGLSLCQAIVTAHGGRIEVFSSSGQGSRFCVRMPLKRPAAERQPQPAA